MTDPKWFDGTNKTINYSNKLYIICVIYIGGACVASTADMSCGGSIVQYTTHRPTICCQKPFDPGYVADVSKIGIITKQNSQQINTTHGARYDDVFPSQIDIVACCSRLTTNPHAAESYHTILSGRRSIVVENRCRNFQAIIEAIRCCSSL